MSNQVDFFGLNKRRIIRAGKTEQLCMALAHHLIAGTNEENVHMVCASEQEAERIMERVRHYVDKFTRTVGVDI